MVSLLKLLSPDDTHTEPKTKALKANPDNRSEPVRQGYLGRNRTIFRRDSLSVGSCFFHDITRKVKVGSSAMKNKYYPCDGSDVVFSEIVL
jgi:hypothetical protein